MSQKKMPWRDWQEKKSRYDARLDQLQVDCDDYTDAVINLFEDMRVTCSCVFCSVTTLPPEELGRFPMCCDDTHKHFGWFCKMQRGKELTWYAPIGAADASGSVLTTP